MISLREHRPSKERRAQAEQPTGDFIPYACHYDNETILTKSGELMQILRLDGYAFESADAEDLDLKKRLRNVLLKSIASQDYALWFHTVRKRQPVYPSGEFLPGFAEQLNTRWKLRNDGEQLFQNTLYISIIKRGLHAGAVPLRNWLKNLTRGNEPLNHDALIAEAQDLRDIVRRFEAALADYGPHVLTVRCSPFGRMSEPLSFLSRLINLEDRPVLLPSMDISSYLPAKRLFFGANAIECRGATGSKYAAILSIKEYSAETRSGLMDGFFHLPFEFVISQSFVFSHRHEALVKMQRQQRRMEQTEDLAVSQTEEIDQALDDAMSGSIAFGEHHLTVLPIVRNLAELNEAVARIESELINLGIIAVREDLAMEPCFWAQLPANFSYIARRSTLHTENLAGFASLHNYLTGHPENNAWGPAITLLQTPSGTPYFFNFHVGDVGHTLVVGPTGCGKTALVNFLCAQAMKVKGRLIYFDRDHGADIFIRALGGVYAALGPAHDSGFNPLRLPDTTENRVFLLEWMESLVTAFGDPCGPEDIARISEAIAGNYKLAPTDRTLANIAPFLGMEGAGRLASRIALWHGRGALSRLFGGLEDTLTLDKRVMGFDLTDLLKDETSVTPVLLYLFHRIASALDGTPTLIVLDEAWAMFKNPIFSAKIEAWLKTFRKLNAVLVLATQSVEDAIQSPISPTLVGQTATHIYFPNPKATDAYRTVFKLSEKELQLLREDFDKESRFFLLKQGRGSVIARADLSLMPDLLSVLSGRAESVARMHKLRAQVGDHPASWLPLFMEGTRAA